MRDVLLLSVAGGHTLRTIEVGLISKPGATLGISLRRILIGSQEAVVVDKLEPDSVAATAKTICAGHLLTSINGVKTHNIKHAADLLRTAEGEVRLVLTLLPPLGSQTFESQDGPALDCRTAANKPVMGSKGSMATRALASLRRFSTARHASPRSEVAPAGSLIEGPMRAAKRAKVSLAHSGASLIHTCLPERQHAIVGQLRVEEASGDPDNLASSQDVLESAPPRVHRTVSLGTATTSVQSLVLDPD